MFILAGLTLFSPFPAIYLRSLSFATMAPNPTNGNQEFPDFPNSYIPALPAGVDPSTVDFREFYPYIPNEVKHRKRTTQAQLELLEDTFSRDKKPNGVLRATLARELDMTPRGVQVCLSVCCRLLRPLMPSFTGLVSKQVNIQDLNHRFC